MGRTMDERDPSRLPRRGLLKGLAGGLGAGAFAANAGCSRLTATVETKSAAGVIKWITTSHDPTVATDYPRARAF